MLGVNQIRFLVQQESCQCKYRLNKNACNSKQKWNHDECWCERSKNDCNSKKKKKKRNHDECWCECKELDDWSSCKDDYLRNSSACDSECNKAWKICAYLDIKNFSCKERLFGKLVLPCGDEILNLTEATSTFDKKVKYKKNCFIH